MKILQICYKLPFPPNDGGAYSIYSSSRSLLMQFGVELQILAMQQLKNCDNPALIPTAYKKETDFVSVPVNNSIRALAAFKNLFSSQSYFTKRFLSKEFDDKLIEILSESKFDILLLEHVYLGSYIETIRKYSSAKIILRAQNVEHQLWETILNTNSLGFLKRSYLRLITERLKKEELEVLEKIDGLICLTAEDLKQFKRFNERIKSVVIPIGFDIDRPNINSVSKDSLSVYHLGSMDWFPNLQGVNWFLNDVLPLVQQKTDQIAYYFAGKNMPQKLLLYSKEHVTMEGQVEDSITYQLNKDVLIVPLLSGGGIRVKIIEGLALGKVIVSTSKGAEGIDCSNEENILIADSPEEFCNAIIRCYESKTLRDKLSLNARLLFEEKYQLRTVGKMKLEFFEALLNS